eukprot:1850233-Rhodomonas_salina.2
MFASACFILAGHCTASVADGTWSRVLVCVLCCGMDGTCNNLLVSDRCAMGTFDWFANLSMTVWIVSVGCRCTSMQVPFGSESQPAPPSGS